MVLLISEIDKRALLVSSGLEWPIKAIIRIIIHEVLINIKIMVFSMFGDFNVLFAPNSYKYKI